MQRPEVGFLHVICLLAGQARSRARRIPTYRCRFSHGGFNGCEKSTSRSKRLPPTRCYRRRPQRPRYQVPPKLLLIFHLIVISAVAVIELFVKRVWLRSQAMIHRLRSGDASPTPPTIRQSPITRLPHEIVEMIIAHLVYDAPSLRACTLTCHSWYIVAFPHLHHTLHTTIGLRAIKLPWPNPLQHMHKLGLLPFIRTLYIESSGHRDMFSPKQFDNHALRQFSALTNVRRLMLSYLDISSFMPNIRRYFGHFSSTVRGLSLRAPHGTRRQIIYFIGLFEHLQDLDIIWDAVRFQDETEDDTTLTPLFTPPLRGRLKLSSFGRVGILRDMIDLFGGIRFHTLDLLDVEGVPLLLDACAKTLTTLKLHPSDPRGR